MVRELDATHLWEAAALLFILICWAPTRGACCIEGASALLLLAPLSCLFGLFTKSKDFDVVARSCDRISCLHLKAPI